MTNILIYDTGVNIPKIYIKRFNNEIRLNAIVCLTASIAFVLMVSQKPAALPEKENNTKYILEWVYSVTYRNAFSPIWQHEGKSLFTETQCPIQNCFISKDRNLFGSVSKYDAIIFFAPFMMRINYFPNDRSPNQIYIFANTEPPVFTGKWQYHYREYFNWTMTYRLDSDVHLPYLTVRDKYWNIVGPKADVHWLDSEDIKRSSLSNVIKEKLQYKSKAVAWFVSNCNASSGRGAVAEELQKELQKYELSIDIYGSCGTLACSNKGYECFEIIKRDYYFYLAFENSLCKDYVTEKLLNALRYSAVPVVYGGADYTRFMPDGSYLDARKLGAEDLAQLINELMQNRARYYQYFKWRNFYSYHDPGEYSDSNPFCQLCAKLHDDNTPKVYTDIYKWWNNERVENITFNKEIVNGVLTVPVV